MMAPVRSQERQTMDDDTLLGLMVQAKHAATSAEEARTLALPTVVEACRTLEKALQEALGDEPLRGLKSIGTGGEKLYAARVRAPWDSKIPKPHERGGRQRYLCIDPKGRLILAFWNTDDGLLSLSKDPAPDDALRVDDIRDMASTLNSILPRHVKSARSTGGRYRDLQRLALRIRDAVGSEDTAA